MRRMYSEQELTDIVKKVAENYIDELIEDGAFDEKIVEAVDDYLDENPIVPSDLDFTSIDFVAKTLNQLNPNYSLEFNMLVDTPISGESITQIYNRFEVINGVLYLVINAKVNACVSAHNLAVGQGIIYSSNSIDSEVAKKIYDLKGKSVYEVEDALTTIARVPVMLSKTASHSSTRYSATLILINGTSSNNIRTQIYLDEAVSLSIGDELYLTGRIALTLL